MVLNIVKNKLSASDITDYVKKVFESSEVEIQKEYCVSVDISVTEKNVLHSLEGAKRTGILFQRL